jgi:thiazole synthase ThiGH ThiG subunit
VVGPDGVALGTSYSDKADAEEMAAALSLAYDKGREAERAA